MKKEIKYTEMQLENILMNKNNLCDKDKNQLYTRVYIGYKYKMNCDIDESYNPITRNIISEKDFEIEKNEVLNNNRPKRTKKRKILELDKSDEVLNNNRPKKINKRKISELDKPDDSSLLELIKAAEHINKLFKNVEFPNLEINELEDSIKVLDIIEEQSFNHYCEHRHNKYKNRETLERTYLFVKQKAIYEKDLIKKQIELLKQC